MTTNFVTAPTQNSAGGVLNHAFGHMATDSGGASDNVFTCGFVPRKIVWTNVTDRIRYEWVKGMTSPGALKTVANGTVSLETTEGITVGTDGTFTIPLAIILASKTHVWEAIG